MLGYLLGDWLVEITYGRIGTRGRRIRYAVQGEAQAKKPVRDTLRRRATARKRIGVAYRFCQLIDPLWSRNSTGLKRRGLQPRLVSIL
jgi:hypothetical protein